MGALAAEGEEAGKMDTKKFLKILLFAFLFVLLVYFFAVYLPLAFSGKIIPNPFAITVGVIQIRWYGILIAGAILVSYLISRKQYLSHAGANESVFDTSFLTVLICGLVGARIGYVVQNLSYYSKNAVEIIKIWDGGLSIHGALIGGLLGLSAACFIAKKNFFVFANSVSPQILLAGAIGRFGNFFNQEIIGKPTTAPWKMFVAQANRPAGFENFNFFHPVFLYEAILLFLAYIIYLFLKNSGGKNFGLIYTLIIYSTIRIIVEFWRIDYKPILWKFDLAQLVSFGIIIFAIIFWITTRNLDKKAKIG